MIEFNVLGPLEIRAGGRVHAVQGFCQKALLVALLVADGRLLSKDALSYELWGAAPPDRIENAMQAHVSRLRRTLAKLEPHRPHSRLRSHPAGYRLALDDAAVDGQRFVRTVEHLAGAAAQMSPDALVEQLRRAMSAWRGPVLGGLSGGQVCQAGGLRYEQARLHALSLMFDGELRRGNHAAIVAELSALVTTPSVFQEKFVEQLMVALYRCGRQTDALEVGRRTLAGSTRLSRWEQAILSHDPALRPLSRAA
jgi:DNA-binding SARP family transcriptional activator